MPEEARNHGRFFDAGDNPQASETWRAEPRVPLIHFLDQPRPMTTGCLFEIGLGLRIFNGHALGWTLRGRLAHPAPAMRKSALIAHPRFSLIGDVGAPPRSPVLGGEHLDHFWAFHLFIAVGYGPGLWIVGHFFLGHWRVQDVTGQG